MRIYLLCPANRATGGTELLHQFSACLTENGIENYMVYLNKDGTKCPTPDTFLKYGVKYVSGYVDAEDAVLVLAETQVHYIDRCVKGTVMLWWLSASNYLEIYGEYTAQGNLDPFGLRERKNVLHFVQSHFAMDFVKNSLGIDKVGFLMDYINDDIVNAASLYKGVSERSNICLYNPKKGYEELKPVIENCRKDIEWIPLQGLKPEEMAMLMCRAKLYVDFGKHPGKDRIPREAAICGCCVMTNRRGSAAYAQDVFIPEEYKIADTEQMNVVRSKLYDLIDNYEDRTKLFEPYRAKIMGEKAEFLRDLQQVLAVLTECVEARVVEPRLQNAEMYQGIHSSMQEAIDVLGAYMVSAQEACNAGDKAKLIGSLYDMDYILTIMRETVYAELNEVEK